MDNYNKRLLLTLAMCFVVTMLYTKFFLPTPPAKQASTQPAATQVADGDAPSSRPTSTPISGEPTGNGAERPSLVSGESAGDRFSAVGGTDDSPITIGDDTPDGDNRYKLKLVLDPLGACVQTVTLAEHRETVKRRKKDPTPPAYRLLEPLKNEANGVLYRSFVAESIRLPDDDAEIKLSDLTWKASSVADESGETVRFSVVIKDGGFEAFELTRTFHISVDSRQFELRWDVRNLTELPYKILLTGSGPIGVERADSRFDSPRVMVALIEPEGRVVAGEHMTKAQVVGQEDRTHTFKPGDDHIYWYALSNKYFTCLVFPRPLDDKSAYATYLDRVSAMPRFPDSEDYGDMTAEQVLAPPKPIGPGDTVTMAMDVYCGDKSEKTFESNPVATARHYVLTTAPDRSACTFESIGVLMRWLLDKLHLIVRNYGMAIIILVIVVRVCLHPITRKGQLNMMKMQKNQARLKPKLELIQKQFKNDKQKLGEETMKLYREEGINPASTLSGCLPMLLQTPIWIALYTTLNTGISLRHQPFFGYIRDLSAPDVLVHFDWTLKIPLLWKMMGPINSLNILPIIMAGVMFAQMKLSQKMAKDKKADEAAERAKAENPAAEPAQDMMAQQQKMMMFMMPLFGLMFYNMPSGLCLYILSNSVLGMVELYFIRKKLREDEAAGKLAPVTGAPKKQGRLGKWMAELQERAEKARLEQGAKPKLPQTGKVKKKPRF